MGTTQPARPHCHRFAPKCLPTGGRGATQRWASIRRDTDPLTGCTHHAAVAAPVAGQLPAACDGVQHIGHRLLRFRTGEVMQLEGIKHSHPPLLSGGGTLSHLNAAVSNKHAQ